MPYQHQELALYRYLTFGPHSSIAQLYTFQQMQHMLYQICLKISKVYVLREGPILGSHTYTIQLIKYNLLVRLLKKSARLMHQIVQTIINVKITFISNMYIVEMLNNVFKIYCLINTE